MGRILKPLRWSIRPADAKDSAAWARLRHALWPEDSERAHRQEIERYFAGAAREPLAVFLAEVAGENGAEVAGLIELSLRAYAEGCDSSPVGYVEGWYVLPRWRRRGLGRALLRAGEDWARARGCRETASDTEAGNRRSRRAHLRAGYTEVGTVVCFRRVLRPLRRARRPISGAAKT
jgi:aminoglycoside 6'-N-acetyltransferase I